MIEKSLLYFEQEYRKCPLSLSEWLEANPDIAAEYTSCEWCKGTGKVPFGDHGIVICPTCEKGRSLIEQKYYLQLEADRAFVEAKARRNQCPTLT